MNNRIEDQMIFPSQMYRDQGAVGQGRQRRRRRRNESESATAGWKKRKLNSEQLSLLEMNFGNEHKLECERKDRLASELGLDPRTVAVWFQNRRARWKSKKMEEEYFSLKKSQESVHLQNSQLESEIMKLKEQLMEAEKEIQRLSSNSPSSSFSIDDIDEAAFVGQFGSEDCFYMQDIDEAAFVEQFGSEDCFYMQHDNYIIPGMEWVNLYD